MMLTLNRLKYTKNSTIGELILDGVFLCHTLEDVVRAEGVKVYGETAIPEGEYSLTVSYSPKYKRLMPLIYNKPDLSVQSDGIRFDGIRIHSGNDKEDTHGCVLVGLTKSKDFIGNSRTAYKKLMSLIGDVDIIPLIINNIT